MLPREAANIHPEKHNILVFLSNTLFPPFYVPSPSLFPILENGRYLGGTWEVLGRYLGGTWEERFRFTFVTSLLSNRYQSEVLSKIYRRPIEHLSNIYRRPIEHLSKTYRRWGEEGAEREQRKNLATKLQNSETSFSPFWSLVSLNGTFWHFLVVSFT